MPTHAELAKIHIAKRDLKLTDPLFRGFLNVLFGQGSARDLTHEQVEELLEHFKSLGWKSEYTKSETENLGCSFIGNSWPLFTYSSWRGY